ncbi:MAG: outer membrane protein assembly factor BamE [Pseudomonadota bacterium]
MFNRIFAGILVLTVFAGCSPTFDVHGYIPTASSLVELEVGRDDKLRVAELVGRPTSTGVVNDDGWYYIQTRIRNFTYNEPEVIERQLLAITFDGNDRIQNIETLTLADGKVINLNRRVTDLPIKGPTFWQQILASIGNFQASDFVE